MNTYLPADQNFFRIASDAGLAHLLFPVEPRYVEEPRGRWKGQAEYVARPKSTEDVSALLKLCNTHRVAIIPYGGGTGFTTCNLLMSPKSINSALLSQAPSEKTVRMRS